MVWASHRGLSEVELLDLLGTEDGPLPKFIWLPLTNAASDGFVNRGGLLNFAHPHLRQSVRERYLQQNEIATRRRSIFAPALIISW
jgi:hypothetical protein